MKPEQVKTRLQRQVEEVKARKQLSKEQESCQHEWVTTEESLPIDNPKFIKANRFNAYFIKKTCTKCQRTALTDYIVE